MLGAYETTYRRWAGLPSAALPPALDPSATDPPVPASVASPRTESAAVRVAQAAGLEPLLQWDGRDRRRSARRAEADEAA
jgi:hypothetical protein